MEVRSKKMRLAIHRISPKTPSTRGSISKNIQVLVVWRVHSFSLSVSAVINFVLIIRAGTYNSAIQGKVKSRNNFKNDECQLENCNRLLSLRPPRNDQGRADYERLLDSAGASSQTRRSALPLHKNARGMS